MKLLKTDQYQGLSGADFDDRDAMFGSNYKAPPKLTPFCRFFIGALDDFMLKLLIACACISIVIEMGFGHDRTIGKRSATHLTFVGWIEGTAIFVAVFLVSFVGAWNDYKKEIQFLKLQQLSEEDNVVSNRRP